MRGRGQGCEAGGPVRAGRMARFIATLCLLGAALSLVLAPHAAAETRLALVIGNGAYAKSPLANPKHDAGLVAQTLRTVGFDVIALTDADQALMKRSILDFGRRLRASDSVGLFYYAGHGVQVDGENYLIPVGADISDVEEVALNGVGLTDLMKTMERAGSRLNIAVLDACRDNPFETSSRSGARGLAPVDAPTGTLIAYATAPGRVALDGTGSNSPYTAALAEAMATEGAPLEEVFRRTRRKVLETTGGRQTPWEHSSLTGEFFFRPKLAAPEATLRSEEPASLPSDRRLAEIEAWDAIKSTHDPVLLRRHLEAYPDGLFHELATLRLVNLETVSAPWSWIVTGSTPAKAAPAPAELLYEKAVKLDAPGAKLADLKAAAGLYRDAADAGLAAAMFSLARAYDKGRGVGRDLETAALWYRRAADAGHVAAMASLGTMFEFGEGVEQDWGEAVRLYGLASAGGDANAKTSLAYLYQSGKGIARRPAEARRLYVEAAALGAPRAMFNAALMMIRGEGGRTDLVEAARLLEAASAKGHHASLRELAVLYDEGRGVARDSPRAARLLLTAFKSGDSQARRDLLERPDAWSYATRREVQRRLKQAGLYSGPVHGFFNDKTHRALERYSERS